MSAVSSANRDRPMLAVKSTPTSTFLHHAIDVSDLSADRVCGALLEQHVQAFGTSSLTYLFRDMRSVARRVMSAMALCYDDGQPRVLRLAVSPVSVYAEPSAAVDFDNYYALWLIKFDAATCSDQVDGCHRHIEIRLVRDVA